MEIRVYCECIEQGEIFFLPLFTNAFPDYEVKLARIPRANQVKKNRGLKGVFDLANPDGLATFVDSEGEFPFATFEISDAVKTEDHELQRYPQVCSSVAYDLVHIKISPHNKGTSASFGGNVNFNPLTIPTIIHRLMKLLILSKIKRSRLNLRHSLKVEIMNRNSMRTEGSILKKLLEIITVREIHCKC